VVLAVLLPGGVWSGMAAGKDSRIVRNNIACSQQPVEHLANSLNEVQYNSWISQQNAAEAGDMDCLLYKRSGMKGICSSTYAQRALQASQAAQHESLC
jgi:acetate kinase